MITKDSGICKSDSSRSDFGLELLDFVIAGSKTGYVGSVCCKFDKKQR